MNAIAAQADFSFVHLTDTHIMAGGKWKGRSEAWEFDTAASLRRVVEAINTLVPQPAFAVLGGDLASPDLLAHHRARSPEEYEPSEVWTLSREEEQQHMRRRARAQDPQSQRPESARNEPLPPR